MTDEERRVAIRAYKRAWRQKNWERVLAYNARWMKAYREAHPECRAAAREYQRRYRARRKST